MKKGKNLGMKMFRDEGRSSNMDQNKPTVGFRTESRNNRNAVTSTKLKEERDTLRGEWLVTKRRGCGDEAVERDRHKTMKERRSKQSRLKRSNNNVSNNSMKEKVVT